MWSSKAAESSKSGGTGTGSDTSQEDKPNTSVLRKPAKIGSLVCADYNDFDDDSHTPPQTPPTGLEAKQGSQSSSLTSSTLDNGPLDSPGEKLDQLADTADYDDDKTIVNTEVTLSSAAQRDSDDITVIEQFGDSELVDVISGSLEGDMQEEYVLFESGMVVDLSADSNDSLCHALVNADGGQGDLVQILEINPESQSEEPILSDDDLVPSNTRNKKGLRLDIVRTLQAGKKLVAVTDTSESPDQDELRVDPLPGPYLDNSPDQDLMVSLVSESEVVIIDPTTKSPEDNLSKGSCDEETEKTDVNLLTDVSKDNTVVESLIDDQTKPLQKDSKQNKCPTSFIFPEKVSYSQTAPSTIHQTNVSATTTPKSSVSSVTTAITSILNANLISTSTHTPVLTQTILTEANTTSQDALLTSFSNQKSINLPSTMASIVADAKLAARLSQTALENMSNSQQGKSDPKINETPKTSPPATTSSAQSEFPSSTSVVETLNSSTKLVLSIQSASVTLSTSKMTDLLKKESALKTAERQVEGQEDEMKKKTEEEELVQVKIKDQSVNSVLPPTLVTEEKMNDPLNTTDELESMLEAIHNPAEATLKDEGKSEITTTTTLKRMSPVADDLSLVNILENDAEPVDNDKEESSSSSEAQKIVNKPKEVEGDLKESKNASPKDKSAEELELESAKPYLQHCLSEEKNSLMEESSDEILDMLQNIISSKPEMANTSELKSSLIYQMPTPLDTLPLNILQDSLMDLDQESLENDQLPSQQESKSQTAKSLNSEVKKSPPAPNQAVAQLQKSTTTVPHLSPLSKPTELTSNVAHVTDQLRTLLSSLQSNQTTGNQTGVVTMVSSVKPGTVLSATSTFSTSNSSTNNIPTLSRHEQSRPQVSVSTSVAKEAELTLKEPAKESTGITSTKVRND